MTLAFRPEARPPTERLDALPPVAAEALGLLRLWIWVPGGRETLRLAAPTRFGAQRAGCILGALERLAAGVETARLTPGIRPPDSGKLSLEESALAAVMAAGDGTPCPAAHRLGPVFGDDAERAAQLMALRIGEAQADRKRAPCPTGCPARWDCAERPKLRAVD